MDPLTSAGTTASGRRPSSEAPSNSRRRKHHCSPTYADKQSTRRKWPQVSLIRLKSDSISNHIKVPGCGRQTCSQLTGRLRRSVSKSMRCQLQRNRRSHPVFCVRSVFSFSIRRSTANQFAVTRRAMIGDLWNYEYYRVILFCVVLYLLIKFNK